MSRRKQHVPWTAAGTASEQQHSADDVVRETGWVFNNRTGRELDLAAFVETGDHETLAYLQAFGLDAGIEHQSLVEIGSGIGRMTASFSRMFARVTACDLDGAFLERCRETVAQFGRPERLQTCHVDDGRTLLIADASTDLAFSYITLQHCHPSDALALTREAVRITRPGGHVALNYRTWTASDAALWPACKVVRGSFRVTGGGPMLARHRHTSRVGWQANRLGPATVLPEVAEHLRDVRLVRSPQRSPFGVAGVEETTYVGVHPSHWWLIGTVR
ncbi:MAG: class I SAM-dependent methyltransferase [Actinomycetes bacterium]